MPVSKSVPAVLATIAPRDGWDVVLHDGKELKFSS